MVVLDLANVTVVYGGGGSESVVGLKDLTVSFPEPEIVVVVGPNGAGKTTLVNLIAGSVLATSGTIRIDGMDVTKLPDHVRARWIARVFDSPHAGTALDLSVEENLSLAMLRGKRRGFGRAITKQRRETMGRHLKTLGLGLESRLSEPVGSLSAGQRQSLAVLMATVAAPHVLLLDEHLSALDPHTQDLVLNITISLARQSHCLTLMVTHNLEHAISVGDRTMVLHSGRLIGDFAREARNELTLECLKRLLHSS